MAIILAETVAAAAEAVVVVVVVVGCSCCRKVRKHTSADTSPVV